jgi:hypothetical protein
MANNQLILGAGKAAKKFVDIGAEVGKGLGKGFLPGALLGPSKTALKNKEYEGRVNTLMGRMKTDMDFTSFSAKETSSMRNFLVGERSKYASAAKELAGMTDTTSPEYMAQVDVMNGVNNSFTNLAAQLKSYKEGKATFAKDMLDGTISRGNPTQNTKESMVMYGFIDEDGDGVNDKPADSPFSIQAGGNIGFDIDGSMVDYNTRKPAVMKDYVLSNKLLTGNESAYKAQARMSGTSQEMYRQQLEEDFESRDALMSMVYDFDSIVTTQDLATRWDESENSLDKINSIKEDLIDRLVEARVDVSNKGYNEKKNRQAETKPYHWKKATSSMIYENEDGTNSYFLFFENGTRTTVNAKTFEDYESLEARS